jgi:hypothetical protein
LEEVAMMTITLDGSQDRGGTRSVWARLTDAGVLVVEGQDLGRGVQSVFGFSEYEWAVTVRPEDQPALLDAMSAPDADESARGGESTPGSVS